MSYMSYKHDQEVEKQSHMNGIEKFMYLIWKLILLAVWGLITYGSIRVLMVCISILK